MRNIYIWHPKIHSMSRDQSRRWTLGSFFLLPKAWRQLWKDKGIGSSKGSDFQRRYPRIPSQAINGVLPLHSLCAQICDKYGRIQKVKYNPQCEESSYLQLSRRKYPYTTWSLEQTFSEKKEEKIVHYCKNNL